MDRLRFRPLIDLVMKMENTNFTQAIALLEQRISPAKYNHPDKNEKPENFSFHRNTPTEIKQEPVQQPVFTIKAIEGIKNSALLNYLTERGIMMDVAREHCREIHYSINDKDYFAIGFQNDEKGYELRNPYFKGCTSKAPTTKDNNSTIFGVFEGFMDYLSFLTLKNNAHVSGNMVILNSIANLERAKAFLTEQEKIIAYLDNDAAGRKATETLKSYGKNITDKSIYYSKYKDLNDYLRQELKNIFRNSPKAKEEPEQIDAYKRKRQSFNSHHKPIIN